MTEGFQFKLHFSLDEGAVEEVGLIERPSRQANDIHEDPSAGLCSSGSESIVSNLIQHLRGEGYSVSPPCNQCNNVIINDSDFVEERDTFHGSFISRTQQDSDQDDASRIEAEIEGTNPPNRTEGRYRIILDYFYDADKGQQPVEESSINKLIRLLDTSQEDYGKAGHAAVLKELKPLLRSIFAYLMNLRNRRAPKPVPRRVKVNKDPLEKGVSSDHDANFKKLNLTFEDLGSDSSKSSDSELDRVVNMVVKMRESERLMCKPGQGLPSLGQLKGTSDEDPGDSDRSHFSGREKTMSTYSRSLSVYADDYAVGRSPVQRASDDQRTTLGVSEPHLEGASEHRHHTPRAPSPLNKEMECVDEDGTDDQETLACVRDPHAKAKQGLDPLKNAVCEDASCVSGTLKTWSNDGGRQDAGSAMSTNTADSQSVELAIGGVIASKTDTPGGLASSQPLLRTPMEHKKENAGKEIAVIITTPELVGNQATSPLPLSHTEASPNVDTVPHSAAHPLEIHAHINLPDEPQSNFLATQLTTSEPIPMTGSPLPVAEAGRPVASTVPSQAGHPVAAANYQGTFLAEEFLPDTFGRVVDESNAEQQRLRAQSVSLVETALVNALGQLAGKKIKLESTESSSTLVTAPEGEEQFDIDLQMTVEGTTINRLIKTCPIYPLRDDLDLNLKDAKGKVTVYSQFKNLEKPSGSMPVAQGNNTSACMEEYRECHNSNAQGMLISAERKTSSRSDDFMDSQHGSSSEIALSRRHTSASQDTGEDSLLSATQTQNHNVSRPIPRRRHRSLLGRGSVSDCTETRRKCGAEFPANFLAHLASIRFSPRRSSSSHGTSGFNSNNNAVKGDTYYPPPRCRCSQASREQLLRWCRAFEQCLEKKGLQGVRIVPGSKTTSPNLPLNGWPLRRCHSTCTCANSRICDPLIEAYDLFRPYWSTHRNLYEPDHCLLRHKKCAGRIRPPSIRCQGPMNGDEQGLKLDCTQHTAPCPPPRCATSQSPPVCLPRKCTLEMVPTVTGQVRVGDCTRTFAADCSGRCGGAATEPPSSGSFHTADAMSVFVDVDLGSMRCGHKRSPSLSPASCCGSPCRHRACAPTPPPIRSRHICCPDSDVHPLKEVDKCAGIKPKVVPPCTSRLGPSARTQVQSRCSQQVRGPVPCAARESRSVHVCCADGAPQKHCEPADAKHPRPRTTTSVTTQCPNSVPCQTVTPEIAPPQPKSRSRGKHPGAVKPRTRSLTAGEGPATLPSWMVPKPMARTRPSVDSFLRCRLQHESTCFMTRGLPATIRERSQPAVMPRSSPVSPSVEQPAPACQLKHYVLPARSPNPYLDRLWKMTNSAYPAMNSTPQNGSNYHHLSRNPDRNCLRTRRASSSEHYPRRRNSRGDSDCRPMTATTLLDNICAHVVEHSSSNDSVKIRLRPRLVTAGGHRRAVSAEGPYLQKAVEAGDRPGGHLMTASAFRMRQLTGLKNGQSHSDLTGR